MSHSIVSCLTGFLLCLVRSEHFLLLVTVVKIEANITIYWNKTIEKIKMQTSNSKAVIKLDVFKQYKILKFRRLHSFIVKLLDQEIPLCILYKKVWYFWAESTSWSQSLKLLKDLFFCQNFHVYSLPEKLGRVKRNKYYFFLKIFYTFCAHISEC